MGFSVFNQGAGKKFYHSSPRLSVVTAVLRNYGIRGKYSHNCILGFFPIFIFISPFFFSLSFLFQSRHVGSAVHADSPSVDWGTEENWDAEPSGPSYLRVLERRAAERVQRGEPVSAWERQLAMRYVVPPSIDWGTNEDWDAEPSGPSYLTVLEARAAEDARHQRRLEEVELRLEELPPQHFEVPPDQPVDQEEEAGASRMGPLLKLLSCIFGFCSK